MTLPTICPNCGLPEVERIVYGYPVCIFDDDDPDWICNACQAQGSLGLVGSEKVSERLPKTRTTRTPAPKKAVTATKKGGKK